MLRAIFRFFLNLIKWTVFAVVILISSHLIQWRGQSISDHSKKLVMTIQKWEQKNDYFPTRQKLKDFEKISAEERNRLESLLKEEQ